MLVGTRRPIPAAAPAPRPAQEVRQAGTVLGTAQPGVETPPAAMPSRPSFAAASNAGSAAVRRPGMRSMPQSAAAAPQAQAQASAELARVRRTIHDQVFAQIDPMKAATTSRENLAEQVAQLIREICDQNRFQLTAAEEQAISAQMLDEMLGIGPIEPLLADETVTDILVNGADKVFVERFGKLELTPITFIDEEHVFNIAQRIAARVGRRIDEANPMVDARLADGSRVNVVTKPLALDGTSISIRKFSKHKRNLEELSEGGALTKEMVELLSRAVMARLNIVVSGGTGAGSIAVNAAQQPKLTQYGLDALVDASLETETRDTEVIIMNVLQSGAVQWMLRRGDGAMLCELNVEGKYFTGELPVDPPENTGEGNDESDVDGSTMSMIVVDVCRRTAGFELGKHLRLPRVIQVENIYRSNNREIKLDEALEEENPMPSDDDGEGSNA